MITSVRTYKALILAGMLTAYLAGALQGFLLESFHFVSHLSKKLATEIQHSYYNHTHQHGQVHTHRHVVLETMQDALDDSEQDGLPQEDQQKTLKKKNPEQLSNIDPIAFFSFFVRANPAYRLHPVAHVFNSIPTPPPQLI